MLAEILLQKYEYHVPFYRQVKQPEHLGVKLSRNTLNGWFKPVCELLRPLYLELKRKSSPLTTYRWMKPLSRS